MLNIKYNPLNVQEIQLCRNVLYAPPTQGHVVLQAFIDESVKRGHIFLKDMSGSPQNSTCPVTNHDIIWTTIVPGLTCIVVSGARLEEESSVWQNTRNFPKRVAFVIGILSPLLFNLLSNP